MARRPTIPSRPSDISLDWLRQALACSGGFEPSQLRAVHAAPVGSGRGLLSTVIRCRLEWSGAAPQRPGSVIIKCYSADRKTFRLARILNLYRREYEFYRLIRPLTGIRSPKLLYGDFAAVSHRFVMIMEDLSDLEAVNQVSGASQVQVKCAVRAVARMHALYWNDVGHPALSVVPD